MTSGILALLADAMAPASGDAYFRNLARFAAAALGARYAFVAETLSPLESRSLAYWEGSGFGEGFSYRFPGTPCQRVAQGNVCATSERLQELFPEDAWLQQIGAVSYVGVPMRASNGRVLGHVAVLHVEPMRPTPEQMAALEILAARGCAELERVLAERRAGDALAEVERLRDRLQAENLYLQEELGERHDFHEIVGNSPAWQKLVADIESIAASDAPVLIQGETGTGKELVARALHARSRRRDRALVKVNCGAISAGLVESELFGHVKGAFTGAVQKRDGRFELADGGTIFLDEVGELPLDTQVKLLRVLQEGEFEPVGSSESRKVDVRVLAATNRDLPDAIQSGRFRNDLYYRLNVLPLRVPPLRERAGDVVQLMHYFMQRSARRAGKDVRGISTSVMEAALAYDWPGNVRELANLVERAVVLSTGPVLNLDPELLGARRASSTEWRASAAGAPSSPPGRSSFRDEALTLEAIERKHILAVLESTHWVIEGAQGAAAILNLSPSTARSRMKRLGIVRQRVERPVGQAPRPRT